MHRLVWSPRDQIRKAELFWAFDDVFCSLFFHTRFIDQTSLQGWDIFISMEPQPMVLEG